MNLITSGQLLLVFILALANSFFVAAEFSLVAIGRSRVQQLVEEGHPLALTLQRATRHLDTYLAATQLGITMASIGFGWIGEPALAGLIGPVLHVLPGAWEVIGAEILALIAAFGLVTVLHIVLGELAPKSLALQRTERTAFITVDPLDLFLLVFRPAILALNGLGNWTLRLFGLQPGSGEGGIHSVEELQLLVAASRGAGLVTANDLSDSDATKEISRYGCAACRQWWQAGFCMARQMLKGLRQRDEEVLPWHKCNGYTHLTRRCSVRNSKTSSWLSIFSPQREADARCWMP